MAILHIDTGREMRGGQWQVLQLMQGLAGRKVEARLLAPAGSPLLQAAESLGLDVRPLKAWAARSEARAFHLVHAHDARAHSLGLLCGRPLVVARRVGFPVRDTPVSRWKYGRAARYLAVSEYVRGTLLKAGVDGEKISVVYDGVRVPEAAPAGERTLIVAIDSSDPGKGTTLLTQAGAIAGWPIHFSRRLLDDLPRAAVFVYVSEMEGLGSAALLAMAYGAAVIASEVGGLPEIVRDGETGVLTGNHPEQIAVALAGLMGDPARMAVLAEGGRLQVERRFTVDRMVEQTMLANERVSA